MLLYRPIISLLSHSISPLFPSSFSFLLLISPRHFSAEFHRHSKAISGPEMTAGRKLTRAEVAEHNNNSDAWIIIGNKVYDVTKFLDEHPGGMEVLLEKAGEDRTEAFEDIGHSTDARQMKDDFFVGEIDESEHWKYSYDKREMGADKKTDQTAEQRKGPVEMLVFALLSAVIVAIVYYLLMAS
uniref:Cytochrome b5 n=1 Tax=Globodera rostochiensis TaxID=31243 RepID=A0A914HND8_GLORO